MLCVRGCAFGFVWITSFNRWHRALGASEPRQYGSEPVVSPSGDRASSRGLRKGLQGAQGVWERKETVAHCRMFFQEMWILEEREEWVAESRQEFLGETSTLTFFGDFSPAMSAASVQVSAHAAVDIYWLTAVMLLEFPWFLYIGGMLSPGKLSPVSPALVPQQAVCPGLPPAPA